MATTSLAFPRLSPAPLATLGPASTALARAGLGGSNCGWRCRWICWHQRRWRRASNAAAARDSGWSCASRGGFASPSDAAPSPHLNAPEGLESEWRSHEFAMAAAAAVGASHDFSVAATAALHPMRRGTVPPPVQLLPVGGLLAAGAAPMLPGAS